MECPDCGVPLVDAPWDLSGTDGSDVSPGPGPEAPGLKVAYIGKSEIDLIRAKSFVEAEGITCVMHPLQPAFSLYDDAIKHPPAPGANCWSPRRTRSVPGNCWSRWSRCHRKNSLRPPTNRAEG